MQECSAPEESFPEPAMLTRLLPRHIQGGLKAYMAQYEILDPWSAVVRILDRYVGGNTDRQEMYRVLSDATRRRHEQDKKARRKARHARRPKEPGCTCRRRDGTHHVRCHAYMCVAKRENRERRQGNGQGEKKLDADMVEWIQELCLEPSQGIQVPASVRCMKDLARLSTRAEFQEMVERMRLHGIRGTAIWTVYRHLCREHYSETFRCLTDDIETTVVRLREHISKKEGAL